MLASRQNYFMAFMVEGNGLSNSSPVKYGFISKKQGSPMNVSLLKLSLRREYADPRCEYIFAHSVLAVSSSGTSSY
jgi:hypothetical protein